MLQNETPVTGSVVEEGAKSYDIDFGALRAQAEKLLDTPPAVETPAPVAVETKPVVEQTPVAVEAPAPAADKVETPVEPSIADVSDDALVKVLVDGEEQTLPWKEARGKISAGLKFTKSMQQLARDREALQKETADLTTLRTEREQLIRFVRNPQAMAQLLREVQPDLFGAATAQPGTPEGGDPNEILTREQAHQLVTQNTATIEQRLSTMVQEFDKKIESKAQELKFQEEVASHSAVIHNTLADILSKNPVLHAIPNVEDVLRYNVGQMKPATQQEAKEAFYTVAQGIIEDIGKHTTATKKVQAVAEAKQRLVTKPIEPAGGSSVQQTPTKFTDTNGQVDWKQVFKLARQHGG